MTADEITTAGCLMIAYAKEWRDTGKRPEWVEIESSAGKWMQIKRPSWNWGDCNYRRRPEPKLVPFGPDDITPGMQFREKGEDEWAVCSEARVGIVKINDSLITYEELMFNWECRAVGETEWRPCGKESA